MEKDYGKWLYHSQYGHLHTSKCSICGGIQTRLITELGTKYCPHCGAEMDLNGSTELVRAEQEEDDPLSLYARRRTRQTYTVYLDKELMGRVQRLAKQKDVAASAVIEACVKMSLNQLEG